MVPSNYLKEVNESPLKIRPLGAFSDFVVEKLPSLIASIEQERNDQHSIEALNSKLLDAMETYKARVQEDIDAKGFIDRKTKHDHYAISDSQKIAASRTQAKQLLDSIPPLLHMLPKPEQLSSQECRVALLDLSVCESALSALGLSIPSILLEKTEEFAAYLGRVPALSYQAIIVDNPEDDMRGFTAGSDREHEGLFYVTHQRIEEYLLPFIKMFLSVARTDTIAKEDLRSLRMLVDLEPQITALNEELRLKLDRNAFAYMRKFYTNTHRGLPGPSGLYSACFPTLDALLNDTLTAPMYLVEGDRPLAMLPQAFDNEDNAVTAQNLLEAEQLRKSYGMSFFAYAANNIRPKVDEKTWNIFYDVVKHLIQDISTFRAHHKRSVEKFIPEVLKGEEHGTAGVLKDQQGKSTVEVSLDAIRSATQKTIDKHFPKSK